MKLPSSYRPRGIDDFIGPAARLARALCSLAQSADREPIAVLLWGNPGVGKSALADVFCRSFPGDAYVQKFNGTSLGIEEVEQIGRDLHYRDMFGRRRIFQIEEVDQVTPKAQTRLLTILDNLPLDTGFVCTTNVKPDALTERFQTRFAAYQVLAPEAADIRALLLKMGVRDQAAGSIAELCCGNVRQALLDATTFVSSQLALA